MARKAREAKSTFEVQDEVDDCPPLDESAEPQGAPVNSEAEQFVSKLPNPHPRHQIDIGAGRKMHLLLNRRFRQNAISFEGSDGKTTTPDNEAAEWLKQRGWKERPEEQVWTKQLAKKTDSERYARANSDWRAEDEFVELGNLIRQREGLSQLEYTFAQSRQASR